MSTLIWNNATFDLSCTLSAILNVSWLGWCYVISGTGSIIM